MARERIKPEQFKAVEEVLLEQEEALERSHEQQQELAQLYEGTAEQFRIGTIIQGTVLEVLEDGVLVDIQYKSHGFIAFNEFNEHERAELKPGKELEVLIDDLENVDGNVSLSYEKAKAARAWQGIVKRYEADEPVEGIVTHRVKGGLSVDIGIPAFLPGSQVDVQRVTNFDQYVGQNITAKILKINPKRGNVIISRRKYLNEQLSETRKQILSTLEVGQTIQGIVKNITNYGVFIDIGGVDGLLHITDMTWGRISHPSEIVNLGDTVTVKVLSFDRANEKISLGMKQLHANPWEKLGENVEVGSRIKGKVSSVTDYGLFVEVAPNVEGLVHISEVSWTDRISDLREHYKPGQEVEVLVVSLDKENRRMSLSIKQLEENPWQQIVNQFSEGQIVSGPITNITDFGIFIQLLEGIDGLVHISDLSWTEHIKHPGQIYKEGQEVRAVVTEIDSDKKKISLSIKALEENPWEKIEEKYPEGTRVEGEISKVTDFGAFVKLESGIEGLVHVSEIAHAPVEVVDNTIKIYDGPKKESIAQTLSVGDTQEFQVIKVSRAEQKLGLSRKALQEKPASARKTTKQTTSKQAGGQKSTGQQRKTTQKPKQQQQEDSSQMKSALQIELERMAKEEGEE